MSTEDMAANGIHLMQENKVVMRIERDHIWVDPDVAVDETAQQVIKVLESYIVNMVQREVAAEREACAALCDEDKNKLGNENEYLSQFESGCYVTAEFLAEAIRARGSVNER